MLDFPIRIILGWRMVFTEILVWILAITINILVLLFAPQSYQLTLLTRIFEKILTHPYPYWSIIFLCCIGTFASIYFGDEMMDVMGHHQRAQHHKHGFFFRLVTIFSIIFMAVYLYYPLLAEFGFSNLKL